MSIFFTPLTPRQRILRYSLWLVAVLIPSFAGASPVTYQFRVVNSFPQATDVFTQGLVYEHGILYESAGKYGESRLLTRTLQDTRPIKQTTVDSRLFAEGITILGDHIYQLTWKARRGFIYDKASLKRSGEFRLPGEGWGITHNDKELIVSDGSNRLDFLDPATFKVRKTLRVTHMGHPVQRLNELEWIDGAIYANVWGSDWIVMIDPNSGEVTGKVHLTDLLPAPLRTTHTDVLNGIAYDPDGRRLLVTGKYWPRLYEIELIAPDKH